MIRFICKHCGNKVMWYKNKNCLCKSCFIKKQKKDKENEDIIE